MSIRRYRTPFIFAALAGFALLAGGCGAPADAEAPAGSAAGATAAAPTPVRTAPVVVEHRALPIRTGGRLAPRAEVPLSFKIGGIVDDVRVDEGDRVQAGQRLAGLQLTEIDAQVREAESVLEKARRDHARMQTLYRDSVVTLTQLQDAQTGLDIARAAVDRAAFNRQYAVITAPANGRILRRFAEAGEQVAPGTPILLLGAESRGWVVRVGLADRDVVRVQPGDSARIVFDAFPGRPVPGTVAEIAEAADPATGTFEVEIRVDNPQSRLKAGFVATVEIVPAATVARLLVPVEALVEGDGDEGIVFTLDPDSGLVRRTAVRIDAILDRALAIPADAEGGLTAGQRVVVDGGAYLSDGAPVTVVDTAPPVPPAAPAAARSGAPDA